MEEFKEEIQFQQLNGEIRYEILVCFGIIILKVKLISVLAGVEVAVAAFFPSSNLVHAVE